MELYISKRNYNKLFGDPYYKKVKYILLEYIDIHDKNYTSIFKENETDINIINIKSLINVKYGYEDKWINITETCNNIIKKDKTDKNDKNDKNYDIAIVYWGLTRSTKKVYKSHIDNIFNVLKINNISFKKFMHTWKTNKNEQRVRSSIISKKIDYNEYKLLTPDFYKIENQYDFEKTININDYFYKDVWNKRGDSKNGEWKELLIKNHLYALESQKRGLEMVDELVKQNYNFKYVMFVRPDVKINHMLPIKELLKNNKQISIPNFAHHEGYNDRFAFINYDISHIYGKRINEIKQFRKNVGRIVSEKYVGYIVKKYNLKLNLFKNFHFDIIRP